MYTIVSVYNKKILLNGDRKEIQEILEKLKEYGIEVERVEIDSWCG